MKMNYSILFFFPRGCLVQNETIRIESIQKAKKNHKWRTRQQTKKKIIEPVYSRMLCSNMDTTSVLQNEK